MKDRCEGITSNGATWKETKRREEALPLLCHHLGDKGAVGLEGLCSKSFRKSEDVVIYICSYISEV